MYTAMLKHELTSNYSNYISKVANYEVVMASVFNWPTVWMQRLVLICTVIHNSLNIIMIFLYNKQAHGK